MSRAACGGFGARRVSLKKVIQSAAALGELFGIAGDDEEGVGGQEIGFHFKDKLWHIGGGVDLGLLLGIAQALFDKAEPVMQGLNDAIMDGAGAHAHLRGDGGEEAAAGEDAAFDVG